jgi:predicted Zn finger-like uncharacterized protein
MTRVTTTCPQCATIFRVNPEQLAARRGQVRCGRCRHVFNGYETVSVGPDLPDPETTTPLPPAAAPRPWWRRVPQLGRRRSPVVAGPGVPDTERVPPSRVSGIRAEGLTKMVELVRGGPSPGSVEPGALRIRPAFGIEIERVSDDFSLASARWKKVYRTAIVAGLVIGVPLLLLIGRDSVVQLAPSLRPAYLALCEPLHCQVSLPADADAWSVESNELLEDPGTPQLFHFTATLRNRSAYTQGFPTIDLSLTDVEGLAVDRRVVAPANYLPASRPIGDGLPANSEAAIRIEIRAADRRSQGYRVVLFFP